MSTETKVLTTQELAEYMKLNEKTILKMAQQGELPGVKVGNQWRFHLEAIDRYLQRDIMHTPESELDSVISTTGQPIPLSRLFDVQLIETDLEAKDSHEVLSALVGIADRAGVVEDAGRLLDELEKREEMLSTGVGNGIAVPHPRNPDQGLFKKPNIVFARSDQGVDFFAPDGKKVHLFFMTCAPSMMEHLRFLAKISKLMHVEGAVDKFMHVKSGDEVIRYLLELERKHLFPWEVV